MNPQHISGTFFYNDPLYLEVYSSSNRSVPGPKNKNKKIKKTLTTKQQQIKRQQTEEHNGLGCKKEGRKGIVYNPLPSKSNLMYNVLLKLLSCSSVSAEQSAVP